MTRHPCILIVGGLLAGFAIQSDPAEARRFTGGNAQFRAMPTARAMPAARTAMMRSVRVTTSVLKPSSGRFASASTKLAQRIPTRPPLSKTAFAMPAQGTGVWTNPNGVTPGRGPQPQPPQQKNVAPVVPPNTLPPVTPANLGLRPIDRQMTGLRDKLGLVPIETVTGPGAAPQPSGTTGTPNTPGTPVQPNSPDTAGKPSTDGCVGAAGNLPNPGSIAGWGSRQYREGDDIRPRDVQRLERALGSRVQNWRNDSFQYDGLTGTWRGRTNDGQRVTISFGTRGAVTTYTTNADGTTESRYQRGRDGRMHWAGSTTRLRSGKVEERTPESEDVRIDAIGPGQDNTIAPTPSSSQPVEGAPDNRDYWCETGVTNPDGPNGSRRDEPQQPAVSQFGQPGEYGGSGVQITRNPPPTPAQLFAMVSQPGVSGDVERPSGGSTRPGLGNLAQPRPDNGSGGTVGAGAGVAIAPGLKPMTPRPVDPE